MNIKSLTTQALATAMLLCGGADAAKETPSFYKNPEGLFSIRPDATKLIQSIDRLGPIGIGINLVQPAFVMQVKNVEDGSPAAATGKLKPGQIIETINGEKLKDIDPRIQLGRILADAEAGDGVIKLMVTDKPGAKPQQVVVKIPVLGAYSKTWPINCPKSDKIVRNLAEYLKKPGSDQGFGGIGMLFLLSTGDDKDLEPVRKWVHGLAKKKAPGYSWHLGYGGIPLTEYYLRTGDKSVLPTIQKWVDSAAHRQYFGGWSQKGGVGGVTYGGGGGHLNAGGTAVVTFLMLAKECGVNVPDHTLHSALKQFYRFAGRGNNPYGDGRPDGSFVDNGKNGNLAFAMAAAASLTPEGEKSLYAAARDAAAMTSFSTTTYMLHGHTGGGIGEIWRSAAMGLLRDKKPLHYREFMDNRSWHYDLSRRFDGSFCILQGARYDNVNWGAGYSLGYTVPRKTLRITGAPPSKFSKKFQLPKQPWGTKADNAFVSIEPAAYQNGQRPDFSKVTLASDSGKAVVERLTPADLSEETLRRYAHHQDLTIRLLATYKAAGVTGRYMGIASRNGKKYPKLILEFLKSKDSRVRRAAIDGVRVGKCLTPEIFNLVIEMIKDPEESWWVKDGALILIGSAPADLVVPHVDILLPYLKHEEWWLQNATLTALSAVVGDVRCCQKVLPAIGEMLKTTQRYNVTGPVRWGALPDNLRAASPEVQKLARETLKETFTNYAGVQFATGGMDISRTLNANLDFLATALAGVPGGYDLLYQAAKQRFPNESLPYQDIFLEAKSENFGPELKKVINPLIANRLIPEYIGVAHHAGSNRSYLLSEANSTKPYKWNYYYHEPRMAGLVRLYQRMGVNDYDWQDFGPGLTEMKWSYHTFDPPEKKLWVPGARYRKVTYPKGMENWYAQDFDAKKAGWKTGYAPFGQKDGKLAQETYPCRFPFCRHDVPLKTLWDKEVLIAQTKVKFPAFKKGYRYRLLIGGMSNVNRGEGFRVYVNGKQMMERNRGVGRREGGQPICYWIDQAWWPDFNSEVTISATSFLQFNFKTSKTQQHFSLWFQEMKVPPFGEKEILQSATVVPMLTSDWQAKQDPDDADSDPKANRFLWDGKFAANAKLHGPWKTVAQVPAIDAFDPAKPADANRAPFKTITLKDGGKTNDMLMVWSGDTLLDLEHNYALKMKLKDINGSEFLFIEAGGFSTKQKPGWTSPWVVMKRK